MDALTFDDRPVDDLIDGQVSPPGTGPAWLGARMPVIRLVGIALLLALSSVLSIHPCSAQVPPMPPPDPGGSGRGAVLAAGLGLVGQGSGLLSIGVPAGPGEVLIRAAGAFGGDGRSTFDAGVLYGQRTVGIGWWVRYAGGLGVVRRSVSDPAPGETDSTAGLLAQVDAVLSLGSTVGVGVGVHGAVGGASYIGASFGLYLGYAGLPASIP